MRLLGATSVAALAFGLLPISPASAAITVDDACGSFIDEDGFTDTGAEDADNLPNDVEDAVDCLLAYGITSGKTATTFGTGDIVTRGQLATFVLNILDQVEGFTRPASAPDAFPDDETSVHEANINDAAALGLVTGFNDGTFRPSIGVTRAQMATFLVNTLEEAGITVPAGNDAFTDDDDSVHEDNINSLEELDIVDGEASGDYNPQREVTRGTMAFFLVRTLEVLVDAGLVEPVGTEANPNQTLVVNPQDAVTLTLQTEGTSTTPNADNRTYTVTGLTNGTTYRITLVNATETCTTANGDAGFLSDNTDTSSSTGSSARTGADIADITSVNNAAPAFSTGDTESRTTTIQPVAGSITFTIDGTGLGTVVPVVYVNGGPGGTATTGGTSPRLEVGATTAAGQCSAPVETFGIGGPTTFTARNAVSGDLTGTAVEVTGVNKDTNSFQTGADDAARRFTYDANDLFTVDGVSVGLATFEAALSTGDTISGSFTADPGGVSQFNLNNVNPPAPTSVSAEKGTGAATNDITVTVVVPDGADFDAVVIQRAPVSGGTDETADGTVGAFATIATATADASATVAGFQFVDMDVAAGTFRYRAALVNDGDQGPFTADVSNETSTNPTAADIAAPTINSVLAQDVGLVGVADSGDTVRFTFSEAMNASTATGTFRVQDADGTIADIACGIGGNATCTLRGAGTFNGTAQAANTVLDVVLGTVTPLAAGTSPGLQYPLTITNVSAAFDDAAGNQLNLTGSADRTIETGTLTGTETADTTAPTVSSTTPTSGATGVSASSNQSATFSETLAATSTATLSCNGANVAGTSTVSGNTITFDPTADLADSASCAATFTGRDAAGNVSAATTVSFTTAAATVADTTPPTFTGALAAGGSRDLTVTYNEALACGTVSIADFTLGTTIPPSVVTSCSASTVVLTFNEGSAFATGQTFTLNVVDGQIVTDLAGNNQLDTDSVTFTVS